MASFAHRVSLSSCKWAPLPRRTENSSLAELRTRHRQTVHCGVGEVKQVAEAGEEMDVRRLRDMMQSWTWREKRINYLVGLDALGSCTFQVYAIDLLGFGGSEKAVVDYSMELWRDLIIDFSADFISRPFVIIGNSIGSLAAIMATTEIQERVIGLALLNCAGAMNSKGLKDDWRIRLALPIFWIVDLLLSIRPIATFFFNKLATDEFIRSALTQIYCNKAAVDDDLVDIFASPSKDEGALDVFVSVMTGPSGPRPQKVIQQLQCPVLVLWGEEDTLTPYNNPLCNFLKTWPGATFIPLTDTGHLPHDDRPELVNGHLLPWLEKTCNVAQQSTN